MQSRERERESERSKTSTKSLLMRIQLPSRESSRKTLSTRHQPLGRNFGCFQTRPSTCRGIDCKDTPYFRSVARAALAEVWAGLRIDDVIGRRHDQEALIRTDTTLDHSQKAEKVCSRVQITRSSVQVAIALYATYRIVCNLEVARMSEQGSVALTKLLV